MVKVLSTINTKALKINLAKVKGANGIAAPLYRVVALISGAELKLTTLGDSIRFSGDIEVTVYETGEVIKGSSIYLPAVAEQIVDGRLIEGKSLRVAIEISAKPANTKLGFLYTIKIISLEEDKSLEKFLSSVK